MTKKSLPLFPVLFLCVVFAFGCNDNGTVSVDPGEKLCNSGSGFGARLSGLAADPIDVCVVDDQVTTSLDRAGADRYYVSAAFSTPDGVDIIVDLSFVRQPATPTDLIINGNQAAAFSDPGAVWIQYSENKPGDYAYTSIIAQGDFRVSLNDDGIVVAWFSNVSLGLQDAAGNDAGSRVFTEGFLSVLPNAQ